LESLRLENVYIFNGHLEYITDVWDISWPFGTFVFIWYIFSGFGIMYQEKSGNHDAVKQKSLIFAFFLFWQL
jgi:hypothetical protein